MRSTLAVLLTLPSMLAGARIDRRQTDATVPNTWIVSVKADSVVANVIDEVGALAGISPHHVYDSVAFKGFAFHGEDNGLLELMASLGAIESIEPDAKVHFQSPISPKNRASGVTTQEKATWGLARICRRKKALQATDYIHDGTNQGAGVTVYVVDTGINLSHEEFEGRAVSGMNILDRHAPAVDIGGHGTHVSAIIGGKTFGVAKKANLVAVKTGDYLTGFGTDVMAGIDWAVRNAMASKQKAVINLSAGINGHYSVIDRAVANAVKAGLFFTVAAGNSNRDALFASPASEPLACTIAASDIHDDKADFSNYGLAVDLWAPGVDITSAWIGSRSAVMTVSGTSMAAPYAAGVAAVLLSDPAIRVKSTELCDLMKRRATKNAIHHTRHTTRDLLYIGPTTQK